MSEQPDDLNLSQAGLVGTAEVLRAEDQYSYRVERMRLTRISTGESIVVDGLTPTKNAGRRTRLMIIPDGGVIEPSGVTALCVRTALLDTPARIVDWMVTPWLNGDCTITLERWGRLPQPDPDLYLHVTVDNMRVEEIDGVLTTDGSSILHGRVSYPPGTQPIQYTVCDDPLPELTP